MLNIAAGFSQSEYTITRSLRVRASASAYLNRTPASAGNQKTWTWSGWVKCGSLGVERYLFTSDNGFQDDDEFNIILTSNNTIQIGGGQTNWRITTQVFRDPSAWYHLVFAIDTTQATASNRIKLYVNGVEVTAFTTNNNPALNSNLAINQAHPHNIGRRLDNTFYFDGYLADVYFIDGQALTPSSFGETNALTGVWKPKAYTGTYGTNGFYLDFEDTSSVAALGTDKSGNGNTWTVNNVSLTAGVTYDSMTDVPTLTSETVANYAVLNPLAATSGTSITNGNLTITGGNQGTVATIIPTSGKWYWEVTLLEAYVAAANYFGGFGVSNGIVATYEPTLYGAGVRAYNTGGAGGGGTYVNNTQITSSGTWAVNDVIGFAFDVTNLTLDCYRNNVKIGTTLTVPAGCIYPTSYQNGTADTSSSAANFGQRPFSYTPPTGFVALNAFNLPTATILKGSNEMDIALDTGANIKTTAEAEFTGSQFLEWIKDRANANNHQLLDSVRGLTAVLQSNTTAAETTYTAPSGNSVGWVWKAGASAVSNTDGTITSTVSVNPTAGFSVVTYTGTGANATVGHGLGVAPKMIIVKQRNSTSDWYVYHTSIGAANTIYLSLANASASSPTSWNSTAPTSSVFSVGTNSATNGNANTFVAYCWSEIDGFSKFGSYSANASADGPFIYTGFRPRWVLLKASTTVSGGNWVIIDTAVNTRNVTTLQLFANLSNAEGSHAALIDVLSNGFKIRTNWDTINASGATMIYAAFAENPFKNSLAR